MNGIQWLFFDLGSTLIDESEAYRQRVLEMIQGTQVSFDAFYSVMMKYYKQGQKGDKLAAKQYGFQLPEWKSECEFLYPDAKDCLALLRRKYRLSVIANQNAGTVNRLRAFGIDGFFSVVVASAEEGVAKPDPEIFRIALHRADCTPEQAVMIGDRLDNDIAPANLLGMTTVRIMRGFGQYASPDRDEMTPDYTVNHLSELCEIL